MPDAAHDMFETYLRKFLKDRFPDYYNTEKYEIYGKWDPSLTSNKKERRFRGAIPDLAILSKESYEVVCIGEAKRLEDFSTKGLDLSYRSKIQSMEYVDWLLEHKDQYERLELVYSVPRTFHATTKNILKRMLSKKSIQIDTFVISKWPLENA